MMTVLNVCPVGKPRMTQRDKWIKRDCTSKYWTFCDQLRIEILRNKLVVTNAFKVNFYLPIPDSYGIKKKNSYENRPHDKKFDLDNMIKSVMDALYANDSTVYHVEAYKYYSKTPRIEIKFL